MLSTHPISATTKTIVDAYIGIGSNLEDRQQHITTAIAAIGKNPHIRVEKVSSIIETEPVGGPPGQPKYLNCVIKLRTRLSPIELLKVLQDTEHAHQRTRDCKDGPRTLDLDILLYADLQSSDPMLTLPHPRMKERDFVMGPLREIAPEIDAMILKIGGNP